MKTLTLMAALLCVSCRQEPDTAAKAGRADCDRACARIEAFAPTPSCSDTCLERQWTTGDVRCVADAKTTEQAKDCAVAARAIIEAKGAAERAETKRKLDEEMKAEAKRVDALIEQLSAATDEETRLKLQKALEVEKEKISRLGASAREDPAFR